MEPVPAEAYEPRRIGLGPFANTFVPFGALLSLALLAGEMSLDASRARLTYSIWVAMALWVPALALYLLPARGSATESYRRLLYTFAYLAYLVHFYYAVFVRYGGSLPSVYRGQGPVIATSNLLVTLWWGLDVSFLWCWALGPKWVRVQRGVFHAYAVGAFFMSSVVIFRGFVNVLGLAMAGTGLVCLALRLRSRRQVARPAVPMDPDQVPGARTA